MAKNYVQSGKAPTLIAPAGGVTAGVPVAIDALVVVPLEDAAAGEPFTGHTDGVWNVPCTAGLTAGAKVSLLAGELVADGTAESVPCGKLITAESSGTADLLLVQ